MTETVAEILGDKPDTAVSATRMVAPRHHGQPAFPEPGIYFGMPEDDYHAIHAFSASGAKNLSVSSMDYWAKSVLNLERKEPKATSELSPMELGRAYHCRICEGPMAFYERYYVGLDKEDANMMAVSEKKRLCFTIADIRLAIDELGGKPKGTGKEALIEQLLEFDPDAMIWDRMVANHEKANEGKIKISPMLFRRIEIAAAMIAGDPQLKDAFTGGHAEVSLFWYDEKTGIPCKARLDYLKLAWLVDLKSFSNKGGKPIQRAIDMAISYEKYFIPVVFYLEGIAAVKKLVRDTGGTLTDLGKVVKSFAPGHDEKGLREWCWKWAHQPEPQVLFVFQQTGVAPVTRGRLMPRSSGAFITTEYALQMLKKKWRKCALTFGTDPWVDIEPIVATDDGDLTFAATDFGEINYQED